MADNSASLNSTSAIGAMMVLVIVGAMFFLLMPMYIGALADHAGFDGAEVGNLATIELLGVALISLSSLAWIRLANWRVAAIACCLGLIIANGLASTNHTFAWLALTRALAGVSEGGLLCIGYAALGDTLKVDRNFAFAVVGQILAPGLFFVLLPGWLVQYGLNAIFYIQIFCTVLAMIATLRLPARGVDAPAGPLLLWPGWRPFIGLIGAAVFMTGVTAVWGFVERMGVSEGFTGQEIGNILAISLIASVSGAFLPAWLGNRYTRFWPMVVALALQLLALFLLIQGMSIEMYAIAIIVYSVGWNLWAPYQLSALAAADASGRVMGILPFAQGTGVALGPLIAGYLLTGDSCVAINWIGAVLSVAALLLFIPVSLSRVRIHH